MRYEKINKEEFLKNFEEDLKERNLFESFENAKNIFKVSVNLEYCGSGIDRNNTICCITLSPVYAAITTVYADPNGCYVLNNYFDNIFVYATYWKYGIWDTDIYMLSNKFDYSDLPFLIKPNKVHYGKKENVYIQFYLDNRISVFINPHYETAIIVDFSDRKFGRNIKILPVEYSCLNKREFWKAVINSDIGTLYNALGEKESKMVKIFKPDLDLEVKFIPVDGIRNFMRKINVFELEYNSTLNVWQLHKKEKGKVIVYNNYFDEKGYCIDNISEDSSVFEINNAILWNLGKNIENRNYYGEIKKGDLVFKCIIKENHWDNAFCYIVTKYKDELTEYELQSWDIKGVIPIDQIAHPYIQRKIVNFAIKRLVEKIKQQKALKMVAKIREKENNELLNLVAKVKKFQFKDSIAIGNCVFGTEQWLKEIGIKEISESLFLTGKALAEKLRGNIQALRNGYFLNVLAYKLEQENIQI